jgi:hypothetical protein
VTVGFRRIPIIAEHMLKFRPSVTKHIATREPISELLSNTVLLVTKREDKQSGRPPLVSSYSLPEKYICIYVCTWPVDQSPTATNAHDLVTSNVRMYVFTYVCIYIFMYVCMYICMYVRMYMCVYVCMYVCMCECIYVCMYACMYVRTSMYECMHVCMFVSMYVRIYICVCTNAFICAGMHVRM